MKNTSYRLSKLIAFFLSLSFLYSAHAEDAHTLYLDTKDGRITIQLRPDLAPKHVERIEKLAKLFLSLSK